MLRHFAGLDQARAQLLRPGADRLHLAHMQFDVAAPKRVELGARTAGHEGEALLVGLDHEDGLLGAEVVE